ncbi:MAG: hypothetical protein QGG42_19990, partial [Phycisphaerae bacterium]|nr:hypothetical protein [Phycisphaerae bacterium]
MPIRNPFTIALTIAAVLSFTRQAAPAGDIIQDFDTPGGVAYGVFGAAVAPLPGGPTGDYARLTEAIAGQNGRIGFDATTTGAGYDIILGSLDFLLEPLEEGVNQADGMGLFFLPTATQGLTGDFAHTDPAEGALLTGGLGIGFPMYRNNANNNNILLTWDGVQTNAQLAPFDYSTPEYHHAEFSMTFRNGGVDISVSLTEDINGAAAPPVLIYDNVHIAGVNPYDFRIGFAGRTGGEYSEQQIDNINVNLLTLPDPMHWDGDVDEWSDVATHTPDSHWKVNGVLTPDIPQLDTVGKVLDIAIVGSGEAIVAADQGAYSLTVNDDGGGGGLVTINSGATLEIYDTTTVTSPGALTINGTLDTGEIANDGLTTLGAGAVLKTVSGALGTISTDGVSTVEVVSGLTAFDISMALGSTFVKAGGGSLTVTDAGVIDGTNTLQIDGGELKLQALVANPLGGAAVILGGGRLTT